MKFSYQIFMFILVATVLLTSCQQENFDDIIVEDPDFQPEEVITNSLLNAMLVSNTSSTMDLGCVSISFPFDMVTASGATATINSEEDFIAALDDIADPVVDFIYPVTGTDVDGITTSYANGEDLGVAFGSCIPDDTWDDASENGDVLPAFLFEELCLDLVYPVGLEDLNGNTYTANDEGELIDILATVEFPFFTLPLTAIDENGNNITIENLDEFYTGVFDCGDASPPVVGNGIVIEGFACNTLLYPFDVETANGSVITINDENEYADLILSGESVELLFPFSLLTLEGEIIVVEDIEGVITAFELCGISIITEPTDPCDTPAHVLIFFNQNLCGYVNYPVQLLAGGMVYDINDMDDYFDVYNAYAWDEIDFQYPITVTEGTTTTTLNSDEEVCTYIQDCE